MRKQPSRTTRLNSVMPSSQQVYVWRATDFSDRSDWCSTDLSFVKVVKTLATSGGAAKMMTMGNATVEYSHWAGITQGEIAISIQ